MPNSPLPPDDLSRSLTHARPDSDPALLHLSVIGDTYTTLIATRDTGGRFCLIDMHIPPGGGAPPHRHDFDEMFYVIDGEIEATFRGEKTTVRKGETISIPANAPHAFKNVSSTAARLHCLTSPGGQDEFFAAIGDAVPTRTSPPPTLNEAEKAERQKRAQSLMNQYRNEPA